MVQTVMNEHEWNKILIHFQALCRGHLMRKDQSSVRTQFEDIVREIDGGLEHLHWRGNIFPKPHFTDTESLLLQYGRFKNQSQDHLNYSTREQRIDNVDIETPVQPSDILVPEKDEASETAGRDNSTPLDGESVVKPNLMDDSSTLWSAVNTDISHSSFSSVLIQKGPHLQSACEEATHTSESLRQQRSALAMELLWIQQAITSRKKYLTLRQKMDVSH